MNDDARFGLDRTIQLPGPLPLDSGAALAPVDIAYETYGTLNAEASNAILICHALTGDQYVASTHPVTGKDGWWDRMVGPGKPIDTDRYCVICTNVIGSCLGSSGPAVINPATNAPWGMEFPVLTIADMVRAQALLLNHLGIERLHTIIGGSMGGMQGVSWTALYPERVKSAVIIASTAKAQCPEYRFPRSRDVRRSWLIHGGGVAIIMPMTTHRSAASPWHGWRRILPICPKRA